MSLGNTAVVHEQYNSDWTNASAGKGPMSDAALTDRSKRPQVEVCFSKSGWLVHHYLSFEAFRMKARRILLLRHLSPLCFWNICGVEKVKKISYAEFRNEVAVQSRGVLCGDQCAWLLANSRTIRLLPSVLPSLVPFWHVSLSVVGATCGTYRCYIYRIIRLSKLVFYMWRSLAVI